MNSPDYPQACGSMGEEHMADTPDEAHKPCAKGNRRIPGDCVTAQVTGRRRLNSSEEGEVGALWARSEALKRGRRQETLDAMVMGEVHRPTQAGETTLTPAIFEAGGSCSCIPRIKALQDGLRRGIIKPQEDNK